jgi:hypothetical protein
MDSVNLIASWAGWPIVVAILIAAGEYAGWLQRNRIEHLKETNDALKQKMSMSPRQTLTPDAYGIQILSPRLRETVGHSFKVNGTLKELPNGFEIWVCTCGGGGEGVRYWPQEPAKIRDNAWYSLVHYVENGSQRILVFLVGANGQALFAYFKSAGQENQNWPGIIELTDDILLCASVEVVVV